MKNWLKPRTRKPLIHSSEVAYRKKRQKEILDLYDKWVIDEVTSEVGDEGPKQQFIPHPLWDDEWLLTRDAFDSWETAKDEIDLRGGELLLIPPQV